MRLLVLSVLPCALACVDAAWAAKVDGQLFNYQSTISSDGGGALDLKAELNYRDTFTNAPIAVVMHTYSNNTIDSVRPQAQRLRDQGFFVVSVAMRGRAGSDGVRDSGGLEVYDIYDAVEAVKVSYAGLVDPTNISITGYSGGGGNMMSAVTKFPDYFRAGSSFYGMSDYGYDPVVGWYNDGAQSNHQATLNADIGNPNTGGDAVLDRYMARASNLASKNNPYTEIHLFHDSDETVCPPINHLTYRDYAIANESFAGEFDNITVHVGDPTGNTFVDFDNSGTNDADERQHWPHGVPTADEQAAAEQWYLDRLLSGSIAQPVLNNQDELFVAGYVVTKPFRLFLGNGEDTAGDLVYSLTPHTKTFTLDLTTSDPGKTGEISIDTADMVGTSVGVFINGVIQGKFAGGGIYTYTGLADGMTLTLSNVPLTPPPSPIATLPGDTDADGDIDDADLATAFANYTGPIGPAGQMTAAEGDTDIDGDIDDADLAMLFSGYTGPTAPAAAIPEPGTMLLLSVGGLLFCRRRRG